MTRSRRIRLAILIGALGAAASLFAWARRVSETSRRASPSPAQGIDLLEPERGPLPVRREHTDPLLSAVRIRFEDASGGAVQPVAGLRNSRGEEYQLRAGTLAGEMEPDSPLRVGEYLIDASSPVSGWSSQQRLSVLRNGLYRVPFIVPVAKVRVVVLGPEGAEYRRALRYRVYPKPRFTALAMRRRDLILDLAYGDDAGGPTTPLPPWTAAEGSKFEIRCERGATLRLEVETEEGLSARSWVSTQVDRKDVVVRLDPLVPASFEVGLAGRRVGGGHLLKAYAAGSLTHPDWQGRTDERGQVRLRSYAASGFPVFLLMALGADDSAAPLSYLSLTEGPEAFSVTSQMTLRTGVRLDFPGYEAPIWTVKWPFASDSSKRIIEVWLNVVQGKLSYPLMKIGQARVGADDRIRLPEYVTNPEVELRLPAPNAGIRLSPDPATRCILARTVMPLEGFVVDEEDRPLRGIEVVWSPASEGTLDPGFNPWAFRRASVRTDGDGRFSILQNAAEKGVLRAYGRAFRIAEWRISDLAKSPMKLRLERLRSCTVALTPVPGRLGATLFVRYPRLGMIGLPVPLDGRVAVPLYGGPGLHDVEAVLPRLGSTLAQLTLDRDALVALPLPAGTRTQLITVRGGPPASLLQLIVRWRGRREHFETRGRELHGVLSVRVPVGEVPVKAELRIDTDALGASSFGRATTIWRWAGSGAALPTEIDLSAREVWRIRFVGAVRPVTLQLRDRLGTIYTIALPGSRGERSVRIPYVEPPLQIGAIDGLPVRFDILPARLDASSLASELTVRFGDSLARYVADGEWKLTLHGAHGAHAIIVRPDKAVVRAAERSVGWGILLDSAGRNYPVRASARSGTLHVEQAGNSDE